MTNSLLAPGVAVLATAVALVSLTVLHIVSPEFQPSWRMVSEYANGRHAWLLTTLFACWGIGSLALAVTLGPVASGWMGRLGLAFLVLAGVGELMAACFDINHRWHGPAAMIGIPSLPIAAVLLTVALRRSDAVVAPPLWSMHLTWISFVLMAGAMLLFVRSLSQVGIAPSAQSGPLVELPDGVTSFAGWANRLLVVAYLLWTVLAALPFSGTRPPTT